MQEVPTEFIIKNVLTGLIDFLRLFPVQDPTLHRHLDYLECEIKTNVDVLVQDLEGRLPFEEYEAQLANVLSRVMLSGITGLCALDLPPERFAAAYTELIDLGEALPSVSTTLGLAKNIIAQFDEVSA